MPPELHLAVEAEERVQKEKEELLKAMAYQRHHFCTMKKKVKTKKCKLKELEASLEHMAQYCQAMMADIAHDSLRRKEEEERRYAERLGINKNGNLVDSDKEHYLAAGVAACEAEVDPLQLPRSRIEEEEAGVPKCPSLPYSFVDNGVPFRHGTHLDNL